MSYWEALCHDEFHEGDCGDYATKQEAIDWVMSNVYPNGADIDEQGPHRVVISSRLGALRDPGDPKFVVIEEVEPHWTQTAYGGTDRRGLRSFRGVAPDLDSEEERILDQVVLIAVNEGEFYNDRDYAGAVKRAAEVFYRYETEALRENLRTVRDHAIAEVRRQWGPKRRG